MQCFAFHLEIKSFEICQSIISIDSVGSEYISSTDSFFFQPAMWQITKLDYSAKSEYLTVLFGDSE